MLLQANVNILIKKKNSNRDFLAYYYLDYFRIIYILIPKMRAIYVKILYHRL